MQSRPSVNQTSPLEYQDLVVTIQLEYFVKHVRFIGVFGWSAVFKCMGFTNQLSEHTQSLDK